MTAVGTRGRTVDENGVLLQTSVSQLEMVDTRDGGCMRKWWYRYVAHLREPENDDMRRGTLMHGHLEAYVRNGQLPPSPVLLVDEVARLACEMAHKVIAAGLAPIPNNLVGVSTPRVLVEQSLGEWGFTVAGVRVVGVIDYLHDRGHNTGVSDIEDSVNPAGTIVVGDYKSKKSKATAEATTRYLLDGDGLTRSIQMAGYGVAAAQRFNAQQVRLEHVYAFTDRPGPRKVTRLTVLDPLLRTWEYAGGLARGIRDAALERNVDKVDANRFACDKYTSKKDPLKNRCIHAPYCSAYGSNSLSRIFGESAAADLTATLTQPSKEQNMSLMQSIPGVHAQLAAEETALRASQAVVAAGQTPGVDDATFANAWQFILGAGQGHPSLGYPAAQVYARLCGTTIGFGGGYAGTGALGQVNAHEPMHVLQIASDLGWRRTAPPAVQPAPQAAAPQTLPAMAAPPAMAALYGGQMPGVPSILAPDAPASNPALAMVQPTAPAAVAPIVTTRPPAAGDVVHIVTNTEPSDGAAEATPAKRGRGRPRKNEPAVNAFDAAAPVIVTNTPGDLVSTVTANVTIHDHVFGYELEVFVDCTATGVGIDSLDEYIARTVNTLVAKFCPPPAIPDLRAAPNDGPIGFGKWKAALAATVKAVPPAAGRHSLHTGSDEIRNEVANALRSVCVATGGLFVDGRR